LRKRPRYVVKQ